jgi:TonB-dependent receptor
VKTLQSIAAPISVSDPRNAANPPLLDGGKYPNLVAVVAMKHSYQAFLPALNLVLDLTDDLKLRASVSRTMTRPDPSSMLPGMNFSDPSAAQASVGNPVLQPYYSTNIDLGAEFYTGGEGYIGITAFRKGLSGFTARSNVTRPFSDLAAYGITYPNLTRTQRDAIDARGGPSVATVIVSQLINASGLLTIRGLEFNVVQPLDFVLADYGLKGFGIAANFTFVGQNGTGAAPPIATGISPFTYNLTGYYEDHGLSLRLSYVFNDRQFMTGTNQNGICLPSASSPTCPGGAYLYTNAYAQLDLGSSFRLAELFGDIPSDPEITLEVQNLTKSKLRGYFQYPQAAYAYYSPGTTFLFGLRGSF